MIMAEEVENVLALKDNYPTICENVTLFFEDDQALNVLTVLVAM